MLRHTGDLRLLQDARPVTNGDEDPPGNPSCSKAVQSSCRSATQPAVRGRPSYVAWVSRQLDYLYHTLGARWWRAFFERRRPLYPELLSRSLGRHTTLWQHRRHARPGHVPAPNLPVLPSRHAAVRTLAGRHGRTPGKYGSALCPARKRASKFLGAKPRALKPPPNRQRNCSMRRRWAGGDAFRTLLALVGRARRPAHTLAPARVHLTSGAN